MDSYPEFSRSLSMTLDYLGYSSDMVIHRVHMYREDGEIKGAINAGSKGEGLTAPYESDNDIMIVDRIFVCGDDTQQLSRKLPDILGYAVYKTDRESTPPGYTYLKLTHPLANILLTHTALDYCSYLLHEDGAIYASSDMYATHSRHTFLKAQNLAAALNLEAEMGARCIECGDRSGPSLPITDPFSFDGAKDLVFCFICICPDLLHSWLTRPRYNDWPTLETIQKISHLEAHVVPVGFKGSEHPYKEWRICFTKAELCLIHSMNDTQTKLYILLKMVAKTIIQPVCKDITSYVMKNIALWMAELNPQEFFRQELLIDRLIQSLQFLRLCVTNNFIPNYMITSRNLLAGRLDLQHRKLLSTLLTELINERGGLLSLLRRWPKLKPGLYMMYTEPENLLRYGEWRDAVERLHLLHKMTIANRAVLATTQPDLPPDEQQPEVVNNILLTIRHLLLPDIIGLEIDLVVFVNIFMERLRNALS